MDNAQLRLDTATSYLRETGDGSAPPADAEVHERAIREYTEALAEYVSVSKIFHELVLHGKPPPEDEPPQP